MLHQFHAVFQNINTLKTTNPHCLHFWCAKYLDKVNIFSAEEFLSKE